MPELALPDLHRPEAGAYLMAVMLFPRDAARHAPFVRAVRNTAVRRVVSRRGASTVPAAHSAAVIEAIMGKTLDDEAAASPGHFVTSGYPRDLTAGLILAYVLACIDANAPEEPPTLEHARNVIGTGGGKRTSTRGLSRSNLLKCWTDFAPSVHLSAARLLLPDLWRDRSRGGAALAEFLAYSEAFRRRGETYKAPRSQTTLLDPAETWTVPSRISLPRIELPPMPPPQEMRAVMGLP